MSQVKRLPDHLINKIAAGEVVERPASIVKELVENSLDAQATKIDIEIENGGKKTIRIIDDGVGMDREDALLCLERHATSKIKDEEDLFRILTKGFRGEAIPSIASVSQFLLQTCHKENGVGTEILVEGGTQNRLSEIGRSRGTTIEVSDLFYNIPVRKKFLKTDGTEFSHISEAVIRLAMSNPQVRFRLSHNGIRRLDLLPTGELKQRVLDLLGKDIAKGMYPLQMNSGELSLHGLFSRPDMNTQSGQGIYIFLNGRYIRQKSLTHACREAYRGIMEKGRFPYVVLFLDIPPNEVDVNVHPQKIEVRFRQEDEVYGRFMYLLRNAISSSPWAKKELISTPQKVQEKNASFSKNNSEHYKLPSLRVDGSFQKTEKSPFSPSKRSFESSSSEAKETPKASLETLTKEQTSPAKKIEVSHSQMNSSTSGVMSFSDFQERFEQLIESSALFEPKEKATASSSVILPPLPNAQNHLPFEGNGQNETTNEVDSSNRFFSSFRYLGQFSQMYLLFESNQTLFVMDQHAAHERITYEKLRKSFENKKIPQQHLLTPHTLELSLSESSFVLEHQESLKELGFGVEPFGGKTYVLRTVPSLLKNAHPDALFRDILNELSQGLVASSFAEKKDLMYMKMACHSSVRGNHSLTKSEVEALLEQLDEIQFRAHCPHGRPILTEISQKELEKKFHRT